MGSPDALRRVISIIESKQKGRRIVVVVSALRGITDQLIETASLAAAGNDDFEKRLSEIDKRHIDTINDLFPVSKRSEVITSFKLLLNELEDVLQGVSLIRELTKKTLDFIVGFGERFSAQLLSAALQNHGIDSLYTDTLSLIHI